MGRGGQHGFLGTVLSSGHTPSQKHPISFHPPGPLSLGGEAPRLLGIPDSRFRPTPTLHIKVTKLRHGLERMHAHTHTQVPTHTCSLLGSDGTMERGERGVPLSPLPSLGSSNPHKKLHKGPLAPRRGENWGKQEGRGDPRAGNAHQWVWEAK